MTNEPWRIGRLLDACGFVETPTSQPFDHIEHTPGTATVHTAFDFEHGEYPIVMVSTNIERMTEVVKVLREARRVGDVIFSSDVLDQLEAAGCTLEDTDRGIIINLPNFGGAIRGDALIPALTTRLEAHEFKREEMFFPIEKPRTLRNGPDYLKHDPTKRHSRRKRR